MRKPQLCLWSYVWAQKVYICLENDFELQSFIKIEVMSIIFIEVYHKIIIILHKKSFEKISDVECQN